MKRIALISCLLSAALATACTTSSGVSASKERQTDTTRRIVGTSLIGALGKTSADQTKIDRTANRLCAVKAWTPAECLQHTKETTGAQ